MPFVLVVVDMQRFFLTHNNYNSVIHYCQKEIIHAMDVNAKIIFLEYKDAGRTIRNLSKLTVNYDKVWFETKDIEDGSTWVQAVLNKINTSPRLIKVTGVQTDMCVYNTVEGLRAIYPKAKLHAVQHACGAMYENAHLNGLRAMNKHFNVSVV